MPRCRTAQWALTRSARSWSDVAEYPKSVHIFIFHPEERKRLRNFSSKKKCQRTLIPSHLTFIFNGGRLEAWSNHEDFAKDQSLGDAFIWKVRAWVRWLSDLLLFFNHLRHRGGDGERQFFRISFRLLIGLLQSL
eukprot:EG_transcript_28348